MEIGIESTLVTTWNELQVQAIEQKKLEIRIIHGATHIEPRAIYFNKSY